MNSFGLWTKHPSALVKAFLLTCVNMLCLFAALSYLIQGNGDYLPIGPIAGLWGLVYFITLLPISINGYGLQEISIVLALTQWGNLPSEHSLVVALLIRVLFVVASVPGAFFLPAIMAKIGKVR